MTTDEPNSEPSVNVEGKRMNDWKSVLKTDPTKWLLEDDNPSIRFLTLRDILDIDENNPEVVKAKGELSTAPDIQRIFSKIDINGGPFWSKSDGSIWYEPGNFSTILCLSVLAEFGLTSQHPIISKACEFVFRYQTRDGAFKTGTSWWSCYTAMILRFLLRFGLAKDERVAKACDWLRTTQRLDGGWYCQKQALPGGVKERLESCPWAVLNVLAAFSEVEELRMSKEVIPAIEFLLKHWETRKPIPDVPYGRFGIGSRWQKVRFPFFGYDLLNYTVVLSHYDYALPDHRFKQVLLLLLSKQDEQGRWVIESPYEGWEEFEFGKKDSPSKWATLNALRAVKKVYSIIQ